MRVLVTGASGQLGAYLLRELTCRSKGRNKGRGEEVIGWSGGTRGDLFGVTLRAIDLTDDAAVTGAFEEARPDVVIHAAAVSKPGEAYRDPARARAVNVGATRGLVDLARRSGARFVFLSTDMVFDGEKGDYREGDAANPASVYGRTKREAEEVVLGGAGGVVVRLSLLVGPSLADRPTLFDQQVAAMRRGEPVRLFEDEWRSPLDLGTAAKAVVAAAESDGEGLFHLGGPRRLSRLEMGRAMAAAVGADASRLVACSRLSIGSDEPRPRDTSLDSGRWAERFPGVRRMGFVEAVRGMVEGDF